MEAKIQTNYKNHKHYSIWNFNHKEHPKSKRNLFSKEWEVGKKPDCFRRTRIPAFSMSNQLSSFANWTEVETADCIHLKAQDVLYLFHIY